MKLFILIDSSTKPSSKENKYGESVAAWAAWWGNDLTSKPIRSGIHYYRSEGPNKTFYQGIIRSLEQCLDLCWNDDVTIMGDCIPVISQLRGEWKVSKMEKEFRQVQAIKRKYIIKGNSVCFRYINEEKTFYKKIDQLAKRSRKHITNILEQTFK